MLPLSKRRALDRLIRWYEKRMNVSKRGIDFIAGWEGLRLRMYDDGGAGRGNCTIGIGHLVHLGPCDGRREEQPFINGISKEQAYFLFDSDAQRFEDFVNRSAKVPLTQNQFDALVDFSFNTGGGYPAVWAAVNAKQDIRVILTTAITGAGLTGAVAAQVTEVLKRRRKAEYALYNTPDPEEDDMAERVWNRDLMQTWVIGKNGASPVLYPAMDEPFKALYGPHTKSMSNAELEAIRTHD